MNQCPPGPQVFHWSYFEFFSKICGDIRELMFITGVNDTGDKQLFANISANFRKKLKMAPMEYLEAWGTLIHEKNLKSKISCQTPFKVVEVDAGRLKLETITKNNLY